MCSDKALFLFLARVLYFGQAMRSAVRAKHSMPSSYCWDLGDLGFGELTDRKQCEFRNNTLSPTMHDRTVCRRNVIQAELWHGSHVFEYGSLSLMENLKIICRWISTWHHCHTSKQKPPDNIVRLSCLPVSRNIHGPTGTSPSAYSKLYLKWHEEALENNRDGVLRWEWKNFFIELGEKRHRVNIPVSDIMVADYYGYSPMTVQDLAIYLLASQRMFASWQPFLAALQLGQKDLGLPQQLCCNFNFNSTGRKVFLWWRGFSRRSG